MNFVLSLSFLFLLGCTPLQTKQNLTAKRFTFKRTNKKYLSLKFNLINNLVIIPVRINDSDTLNFILDSGVKNVLITELGVGDRLQLSYLNKVTLSGLGRGETLEAYASSNNNFNISGIIGHHQDLLILKKDIFHLSNRFGIRIHGIMGYNIFNDFIVKINYETHKITFYNPNKYRYKPKKKDIVVPIELINAKPYIRGYIKQGVTKAEHSADADMIPIKLLVDTGGGHAVWLDVSSHPRLTLPEKRQEAYLGKGMRGDITGYLGRSNKLMLADIELEHVITTFPDSSSIASVRGQGHRNGSLGSEILRRFHVIMDYHHRRMILRKNKNFSSSFNNNMAGIEITTPVPNSNIYLVSHINQNSPASKVDIKKNDQIVRINGVRADEYNVNQIYRLFRSRQGKKVKLELRRNGDVLNQWTVTIVLKNAI